MNPSFRNRPRISPGRPVRLAVCLVMMAATATPLYAAEQVTLKNGFDLVCDHQDEADGKVRLYTGKGSDNFLEVNAAEIAGVEYVPDAPKNAPAPAIAGAEPAPVLTRAETGQLMARAGAAHNLDVDLLASVVRAESDGNPQAVSRAGAQGLMQLMPQTAAQFGVLDSFRPDQNIDGGTAYLDALLTRYHDNLALALAAYNAGPAAVDKYRGIPPYRETRSYVARVIRDFNRRKEAEIDHQASLRRKSESAPAPHTAAAIADGAAGPAE